MTGQVVAIASGKGGVGKTTTVVNLGVVLRRADHSVALVDADLGMANLGPMLGVESQLTLHDVLAGNAPLDDAVVTQAPGFSVLAGSPSLTDFSTADPGRLDEVFEALAEDHDYVIVDTGAGVSHEGVLPLGLADSVILVSSPDPGAVDNTAKTAELTNLAEGNILGIVVSKANDNTDAAEVARRVGADLLGVIPYDATVRESTATGQPLEAVDSETPAAVAYRELADALANGSVDPLRTESAEEMTAESSVPTKGEEREDELAEENGRKETDVDGSDEPEERGPSPDLPGPTEDATESAGGADDSSHRRDQSSEPSVESKSEPPEEAGTGGPQDDEPSTVADHSSEEPPDSADTQTKSTTDNVSAEKQEGRRPEGDRGESEDDESGEKSGFLSRIGRLFR